MTPFFHRFSCPVMKQFHANLWPVSARHLRAHRWGRIRRKKKKGELGVVRVKKEKKKSRPALQSDLAAVWLNHRTDSPDGISPLATSGAAWLCRVSLCHPSAQIAWPATLSKRDECKWAGKDFVVSNRWSSFALPALRSYGREASAWLVLCVCPCDTTKVTWVCLFEFAIYYLHRPLLAHKCQPVQIFLCLLVSFSRQRKRVLFFLFFFYTLLFE